MVKKEGNPRIKSIKLSMYYNEHSNDRVDIIVPIEGISNLRIGHISKDIEYLNNGEFVEFNECDDVEVKINRKDISKKDADVLLDNITVFSVSLTFDNGELKSYNMPWCSDDGIYNKFQEIYSNKNSIDIIFDARVKK